MGVEILRLKIEIKTVSKSGMGNLRPADQMRAAWTFDMAHIRIFITKLEYKILPKRSSMTSRYLESKSGEVTLPHS